MRTIFSFVFLFFTVNMVSAYNKPLDSLLHVLDRAIQNKHLYSEKKEKRIENQKIRLNNSLLSVTEKMNTLQQLCLEYDVYRTDSSLLYSNKLAEYAMKGGDYNEHVNAELFRTRVFRTMGLLKESYEILEGIDTTALYPNLKMSFLYTKLSVYNALRDFSTSDYDKAEYENLAKPLRSRLLYDTNLPPIDRIYLRAEQLIQDKQYDEALVQLGEIHATMNPESREAGVLAYSLAIAFRNKDNPEKELEYFARSAIADIKNGVKEYTSLRYLASLMFEKEDIDRAHSYMKCAMEDAIFCNARLRTLEASEMSLIIDKSYQKKEEQHRRTIMNFLFFTGVLFLILFLAFMHIHRQNKKLSVTKDELSISNDLLKETNSTLSEANIIKEEYIGLYIEHFSNYLSKVHNYKVKAQKIAKTKGEQAWLQFLESSLESKNDLEELYKDFDMTILRLFPDFIPRFNSLLAEGEEIVTKNDKSLTPELRIFAMIRLGITDSVKIANFLRYSVSTIYNYRTKMRNKARGNRDEFESKVMQIGLYSTGKDT